MNGQTPRQSDPAGLNTEQNARAMEKLLNLARVDNYRIPKIPSFFAKDPSLWFIQVQASFDRSRITDQ